MLEPDDRGMLLDALRPPPGYALDMCVGTTYSLDLTALMFAPMAFAMFDWATDESGSPDVVALLEAVRRHAGQITLFCQAGEMSLPRNYLPLLTYLESCVVECVPSDPEAIFHPKMWAVRYSSGVDRRYRLLCLTRNLTFAPTWDTMLALDGEAETGHDLGNDGLTALISRLPDLAIPGRMPEARTATIRAFAAELEAVRWTPPPGFRTLQFHALGIGRSGPMWGQANEQALVVSPFLTASGLDRVRGEATGAALVARAEALDALGSLALARFDDVYTLSSGAIDYQDPETDAEHLETPDDSLSALHAKLYIFEEGRSVRVITGSANATDAAVRGNVELLAELTSTTGVLSIGGLLEHGADKRVSLRSLLEPYRPTNHLPLEPDVEARLAQSLDRARRIVAQGEFTAEVEESGDAFVVRLKARGPFYRLPIGVTIDRCWRVSAGQGHGATPLVDGDQLTAQLGHVPEEGLTSFFGLALSATEGAVTAKTTFAVNATLIGGPSERAEKVIARLLDSPEKVMRYLLFLLSGLAQGGIDDLASLFGVTVHRSGAMRVVEDPPLLETMVRALARDPARLDAIARLIADLQAAGHANELLPEGMLELWAPIWEARQQLEGGPR